MSIGFQRTVFLKIGLLSALLCLSGCFQIVRPGHLTIRPIGSGEEIVVVYPVEVVVHSSMSAWDIHQIKDNIYCLWEFEFVRIIDLGLDAIIPGKELQPIGSGVEGVKYLYSLLPDWAPVRIVGGLFTAVALEKLSISRLSFYFFPRIIYVTDWVQDTLSEVNMMAGYIVPWRGPFIPVAVTNPVGNAVNWAQRGILGFYLNFIYEINVYVDKGLGLGEDGWGAIVGVFASEAEPIEPKEALPPPQDSPTVVTAP